MGITETKDLIQYLSAEEIAELDALISREVWLTLPGPQLEAYYSEADELFYGGSAGGGKTDLLLGLALTQHRHTKIFRREAPQLERLDRRRSGRHPGRISRVSRSRAYR
jgi:hypothetical protein